MEKTQQTSESGNLQQGRRAFKQGTPTGSNFEYAGLLTQVALRCLGKKLLWDAEAMKITNVPEANEFMHYEYRKGWALECVPLSRAETRERHG